MPLTHKQWYYKGLKDGIPIGLGYFAVALAMGIAARNAGLTAIQATVTLIVAGTLAGLFPARKAVRIRPIEALRAD